MTRQLAEALFLIGVVAVLAEIREVGGDCACSQIGPCGCGNWCADLADEALERLTGVDATR